MLISPTEPPAIRAIGSVSSLPEKYGADVLEATSVGLVGWQRKEIRDLVNSARDGRLAKELVQMKALAIACVIVEGQWNWTTSHSSLTIPNFTRQQQRGMYLSVQSRGIFLMESVNVTDTISLLSQSLKWMQKEAHDSLLRRPNPQNSWGKATSKDWCVWLLQSFDGIGPKQAERIYEHFNGLPLTWTTTREELMEIDGIGAKRADVLIRTFSTTEGGEA